jgi:hypothetical protein
MKADAGQRVYWTKVSTNTKVRIEHIAEKVVRALSHVPPKSDIANTIVQLQSRAAA